MPDEIAIKKAKQDAKEGKSPSTQAGEFVKREIDKVRSGEHGVKNTKQAIAIGLSEARRAGVKLEPPKKGTDSEKTRKSAESASKKAKQHAPISKTRSRARVRALKKEGSAPVSAAALSRQARSAAKKRSAGNRSAAAKKATKTKRRAS